MLSVAGVLLAALVLVMSPIGAEFDFVPLPMTFFGVLAVLTATYLGIVEVMKRRFYRASGWQEG